MDIFVIIKSFKVLIEGKKKTHHHCQHAYDTGRAPNTVLLISALSGAVPKNLLPLISTGYSFKSTNLRLIVLFSYCKMRKTLSLWVLGALGKD